MNRRSLIIGGASLALAGGGVAAAFAGMGSSDEYAKAMAAQRAPLGAAPAEHDAIRFATLAANGHNTQPWRFQVEERRITILPDLSRRTPAVDPDDHHLYVSLGCASENLALAAAARGLAGEPAFEATGDGRVIFEHTSAAERPSDICGAIPLRQSTRAEFDGRPVSSAVVSMLAQAATGPGVEVILMTDRAQMNRVRDLIIAGNDIQMADGAFMAELKTWMRFNPQTAIKRGDGLFSGSSGSPSLPDWLGPIMFDLAFKPAPEADRYARQINSSAGIAVFAGANASHVDWFEVGRACQRFALKATALGIKVSFVNQPVEVASLRPSLASLIGLPGRRPDIVMRFGYGEAMPMSPRRPPEAVTSA